VLPQNARPVEQANAGDFVGYYTYTDPLRSYEEFHGEIWINADGTFRGNDYLPKKPQTIKGTGVWTFDPAALTISLDWQPGGDFAGPVSGNTADFTINGHWSNGGSGTLRFQRR